MAVIFGTQGRDTIDGTDFDDIVFGWAEDGGPSTDLGDELRGFDGNDFLSGGGRRDTLDGGSGADEIDGGDGDGGDDYDSIEGEAGYDVLSGGAGDDVLSGGEGDDLLGGEAGRDRLNGGGGRDRFEFSRNDDRDTIVDFKDDADTIMLGGARLGVMSSAEALSHARVVNGDTVFTFNTGDVLIVENIADPELLRDDIIIL